jgi:hypothetical protein
MKTQKKTKSTKVKTAPKIKRPSAEQRIQDLETRLTSLEEAVRWQPAQPPGHEPEAMQVPNGAG